MNTTLYGLIQTQFVATNNDRPQIITLASAERLRKKMRSS